MRVANLNAELREIASHLRQLNEAKSRLTKLLEQGCSQEAIDYLGNPILAATYTRKYGVSMDKINKAISVGKIKGCIVDHCCPVNEKVLRPDSALIGIISFRITC